jgi:hypothetical protein
MVRKGHTPEQIINKLREAEILLSQRATIAVITRKIGVSDHMGGILEHQAGPLRALLTQIRQTYLERIQDAVIAGLEALKEKCRVTVFSDSQYVVNAMAGGWARRWQAKGWKRNRREKAINPDLWQRLLAACERRKVHFQ